MEHSPRPESSSKPCRAAASRNSEKGNGLRRRGPRPVELPRYSELYEEYLGPSGRFAYAAALLAVHQHITELRPWTLLHPTTKPTIAGWISRKTIQVAEEIFNYAVLAHGAEELLFWFDSRTTQLSNSIHLSLIDNLVKVQERISVRDWLRDKRRIPTDQGELFVHNFVLRRRGTNFESSIGGLALKLPPSSTDAKLPLTLISQSLYQLVVQARYEFLTAQIESFSIAISEHLAKPHRPGTIFLKATTKMLVYLGADAASYLTLAGSKAVIEYRVSDKGHDGIRKEHPPVELPGAILRALQAKHPFYFNSAQMAIILSGDSRPRKVLILPVLRGKLIVGFFACEYFGRRPPIEVELLPKIHTTVQLLGADGRWLYQRRTGLLIIDPIYRGRDTRTVEGRCCILMPFGEEWSTRVLDRALRPTIEAAGFDPIRADDLYGQDVMEDIWSMILSSEVVIADTTNRNPNVFYELGIAHTLGKRVVLLTQSVADIPFDLNRYRHIVYQDNVEGFETLEESVSRYLAEVIAARSPS